MPNLNGLRGGGRSLDRLGSLSVSNGGRPPPRENLLPSRPPGTGLTCSRPITHRGRTAGRLRRLVLRPDLSPLVMHLAASRRRFAARLLASACSLVAAFTYCSTGARASDAGSSAPEGPGWRRHTIDDSSLGPDGVRLGDINGDGFADVVPQNVSTGTAYYADRTDGEFAGEFFGAVTVEETPEGTRPGRPRRRSGRDLHRGRRPQLLFDVLRQRRLAVKRQERIVFHKVCLGTVGRQRRRFLNQRPGAGRLRQGLGNQNGRLDDRLRLQHHEGRSRRHLDGSG